MITGTAVAWLAPAVQGVRVHLPALLFLFFVSPCPNVFIFGWHRPKRRTGGAPGGREESLFTSCSAALLLCWVGLPSAHPRPSPELPFTPHTVTMLNLLTRKQEENLVCFFFFLEASINVLVLITKCLLKGNTNSSD